MPERLLFVCGQGRIGGAAFPEEDIDGALNKLLEYNIINVFQTGQDKKLYALISDVDISLVYPRYILNTILHQYDVKSKSNGVLIEYLNVLEDSYRPYRSKEKSKAKSKN